MRGKPNRYKVQRREEFCGSWKTLVTASNRQAAIDVMRQTIILHGVRVIDTEHVIYADEETMEEFQD